MIRFFQSWLAIRRAPQSRCLALAFLFLIATPRAHAASLLINHDFTDGLDGWLMIGTVFDTGQTGVLSDQGGSRVVLFQSAAVVAAGTPGLTLSFDFLNALSDVVPLGGTPDSVFISALVGSAAFGTCFDQGVYDAALVVLDADYRGPANLAPGMIVSPSPKGPNWTRFTMPLAPAPFVTIGFEFIDGNGFSADSTAAVDNVLLEAAPVPEPAAAGGLLVALGLWLLGRRRTLDSSHSYP